MENKTRSSVLLIGGAGFIGRYVCEVLLKKGYNILIVDRQKIDGNDKGITYYDHNYDDQVWLKDILKHVDYVINFAYTTVPKTSFEDPVADVLENVPAAVKLFELASEYQHIKKIVQISSGGAVYGPVDTLPITEEHPTHPISPYGITKLLIDHYVKMFHSLKGLPVVSVRPANAYGIGQKPFTGQGIIATAMASCLENKPFTVYGMNVIRDYVYVTDIASGIVAAMEEGHPGEIYNLGSGTGKTNKEVLDTIKNCVRDNGCHLTIREEASRPFDVPSNILNASKLHHDTGWSLTVDFNEGIKTTWDWCYQQTKI